ncbi:hypothetical protein N656DRAFT_845193 [Canariomyces notabilis]|uniref:Uncharacterized protein n=1 Tax=Canariomyces notabilis TaxID=2074819 RepID=A0AAN6YT40_9PEZI|nr:hypothetical protein N656DRAFT_845193 [Canariomyces arenarius]
MEAPKVEAARSGQGTGKLLSGVQRLKPDRASYLRQTIVYLALLVPSYAQSYVGGDLSSQAPYGVPPQVFSSAISSPVADASFPIRGYNTSIPPGGTDGTGSHIHGWSINVGVAENVPLTDSDYAGIDRDNKCIDAATLSITPPADITTCDEDGWRVCAVVFADGLGGSAVNKDVQAKSDGSCSSLLPDDCIRKLQADGVAKGAKAKGSGCADLKIPDECASYFSGEDGTAYKISPVGGPEYKDRRSPFFAWGSKPIFKGNKTSLASTMKPVWPVLLTWSHFTDTGEVHDSAGHLSCVNTPSSKQVATGDSSSDGTSFKNGAWGVAVLLGVVMSSLVLV